MKRKPNPKKRVHRAIPRKEKILRRSISRCDFCGKASFDSRKAARTYIRDKFPGHHFSAYPCANPLTPHLWHVGRFPEGYARGEEGVNSYQRDPRAREQDHE